MDKKTIIIVAVLVAAFAGLVGVSIAQNNSTPAITEEVISASDENGQFGDLIIGNPDAPVKLIEYGDYQCTACKPMSVEIDKLIEEYDGKLAVVFRVMVIESLHPNGYAAAAAALAADRQGYWQEYKDLLYDNQDDWYYSTGDELQAQFEEYFKTVSDGKGDLDQFRTDMQSADVQKKIAFDEKLAEKANAAWTPYFMLDGKNISQRYITGSEFLDKLREAIDAKLATLSE